MSLQEVEESLLLSVGDKWRLPIEKCVDPLKQHPNKTKREECVKNILKILCEAIVQDRVEVAQCKEERRECIEWWFKFSKKVVGFLILLFVGVYLLFKFCQVTGAWFDQSRSISKEEFLDIWRGVPYLLETVLGLCVFLFGYVCLSLIGARKYIKSLWTKIFR